MYLLIKFAFIKWNSSLVEGKVRLSKVTLLTSLGYLEDNGLIFFMRHSVTPVHFPFVPTIIYLIFAIHHHPVVGMFLCLRCGGTSVIMQWFRHCLECLYPILECQDASPFSSDPTTWDTARNGSCNWSPSTYMGYWNAYMQLQPSSFGISLSCRRCVGEWANRWAIPLSLSTLLFLFSCFLNLFSQ